MGKQRFVEPVSVEEAEWRMAELRLEMRQIEVQLGDRNRTGPDGQRLPSHEYHAWRQRASVALAYKQSEYQLLKRWVQTRRRQVVADELQVDPDDATSLLLQAWQLLKRLSREGRVEYEDEEWVFVDLVHRHLLHEGCVGADVGAGQE